MNDTIKNRTGNQNRESDRERKDRPVYSHNPYHSTKFPLLVLDVERERCAPYNEGFRVLHWHSEIQFVYILSGIVHFRIWDREYDLPAGNCMFINANATHYITEKEDCRYHSFLIPPEMLGFFEGSVMQEKHVERILHNPAISSRIFSPERNEDQKALEHLRRLDVLYFGDDRDGFREYEISLCIAGLWLETAKLLMKETVLPSVQRKDYRRIRSLLTFIHENYREKISLEDIAGAANVSKTECLRCFRKYTGSTPYQYLLQYRLNAAAALLKSTEDPVTEIALKMQFPSASAFIGAFRKVYGVTPSVYRR